MKRSHLAAATAVLAAAALTAGLATPAFAQTATTSGPTANQQARLAFLKARGNGAINVRLHTLSNDGTLVTSAVHLTQSDQSTLASLISADEAGLSSLETTIDNDTTVPQATTDVRSIVTSYRIYVLVDPKIHLTVATDRGLAAVATFQQLASADQTEITAATSGNIAAAKTALSSMNNEVVLAENLLTPVPGEVLPLVPAGYPANKPTLQGAATSLRQARQDLGMAQAYAGQVQSDLA